LVVWVDATRPLPVDLGRGHWEIQ